MTASLQELVREARRRKGLTQAQVADAIECKQSAVSMFENGRRDALSREKLTSLGKLLDVDTNRAAQEAALSPANLRYCPDMDCPSNVPYLIGDRLAIRASMVPVAGDAPAYCRFCGEVLASSCPNKQCAQPPAPGAFCASCGTAYIVPLPIQGPADDWVRARQQACRNIFELTAEIDGKQGINGEPQ